MLLAALAVAATQAPQPSDLHTFKDWIIGCDNVRHCQANALAPEGSDFDGVLMLTLARDGGPADPAVITIPLPDGAAVGSRFSLKVDGEAFIDLRATSAGEARVTLDPVLAARLVAGRTLSLVDAQGVKVSEASLAGLSASLLFLDDQQRRVGTVSALKAQGSKPAPSPPAPPPLVTSPPPSSKAPRTISAALAARLIGPDAATCDYATGKVSPRAYRLDAAHSLIVIDNPCGNGAYNFFTSVYVLGDTGSPTEALFDLAPGMGDDAGIPGSGQLTNGDWDPKTRRLSSYEKGRGIGDCGSSESYAWDGARFRLVEQSQMGECRGSVDYIRTWTARTRP